MSFSASVKQELSKIEQMPPCCRHAMAYGLLLFGREFNYRSVSIMTEHECVAKKYAKMLFSSTGINADIHVSKAGKYSINIENREDVKKIMTDFYVGENESILRINRGNLLNEYEDEESEIMNCCNGSFLRGAFLSCGTITDPQKSYHLEFIVPFRTLSLDLMKMLTEYGLKAKHMQRRGVNVIYIKDSSSIEDLLNIMGAKMSAFEIMNIKIYKDLRNAVNRQTNFSCANISRTVSAAGEHIDAINKMIEKKTFCFLPDDLKSFAKIRLENPEASLRELGDMFDPPLSR
ncbi:MAG: DNA-binding protein WhiA, partial [Acutalibacteraceae bacterium]